jgi:hypothetical protein
MPACHARIMRERDVWQATAPIARTGHRTLLAPCADHSHLPLCALAKQPPSQPWLSAHLGERLAVAQVGQDAQVQELKGLLVVHQRLQ